MIQIFNPSWLSPIDNLLSSIYSEFSQRDDANNEQIITLKREHESQRKTEYSKFEDPTLQALKNGMPEKINQLQSRESLNSCGTVSRKTSTASDYTPEHTYVHDSKSTFLDQTNVIFSTDSAMTPLEMQPKVDDKSLEAKVENGAHGDHLELKPGQKVDVKILLLRQDTKVLEDGSKEGDLNEVKEASMIASNVDKLREVQNQVGSGEEVKSKVPQRKISRFLVTPVLSALEMPKDKDYGQSTVDSPMNEMKVEAELEQIKPELAKVEVVRRDSIPLEIKPVSEVERGQEVTLEVGPKEQNVEGMIGPEMITLEQLKKSLDDLKYSGGVRESISGDKSQKVSQAATPVPVAQVHPNIQTPQNQVSSISMSISQNQPPQQTNYQANIPSSTPYPQTQPAQPIPIPLAQPQLPPVQTAAQIPQAQVQMQPDVQINTSIPQSTSLPQVCPAIAPGQQITISPPVQQPQMAVHFPVATSIPQPVQQLPTSMGGVVPLQQGLISPPQVAPVVPTQQNVVQNVSAPQAVLPNVAQQQQAVLPPAVVSQPQNVIAPGSMPVPIPQGVDVVEKKVMPDLKLVMDR